MLVAPGMHVTPDMHLATANDMGASLFATALIVLHKGFVEY